MIFINFISKERKTQNLTPRRIIDILNKKSLKFIIQNEHQHEHE